MDDYIEKMLHLKVEITQYNQADTLPLYLQGSYELFSIKLAESECLLAKPRESINLAVMRKHRQQLQKLTTLNCIFYFIKINTYVMHKMIEEAIPFIVEKKQVYLPFLAISLSTDRTKVLPEIENISFLTQKLLLFAIFQRWENIQLTDVAVQLNVSKMSVSRCFNELDSLNLQLTEKVGKNRQFLWDKGIPKLWELIFPVLRNPVARQYFLDEKFEMTSQVLGGMSALAHYTMINDNDYPTYAISKKIAKTLKFDTMKLVPSGEIPAMIIQIMHYDLPFGDNSAIDPLSALLSISDKERSEPRVETAIDQMIKDFING